MKNKLLIPFITLAVVATGAVSVLSWKLVKKEPDELSTQIQDNIDFLSFYFFNQVYFELTNKKVFGHLLDYGIDKYGDLYMKFDTQMISENGVPEKYKNVTITFISGSPYGSYFTLKHEEPESVDS